MSLILLKLHWFYMRYRHATLQNDILNVCQLRSTARRASAARTISDTKRNTIVHGKCELDSHADTIVAGSNCAILNYTGKVCDVSPYRDDYDPVTNIPIVKAATAWQSPHTGQTYILVFNEALWMGDTLHHSLLNPNQMRHYSIKVQDNPMSDQPLSIITDDDEFSMELRMDGTIVCFDSSTPSQEELQQCPHIVLSSPHPWDPHSVSFPRARLSLEEVVANARLISSVGVGTKRAFQEDEGGSGDGSIFSLTAMQRRICGMSTLSEKPLERNEEIDTGKTDVPITHTFVSSDRHSDVSPQQLSERWGIGLKAAKETLRKTTQRFLRSAVLPLSRRYRTDMMFERKTLRGQWSTDTMDGRCKSLDGNRYAQVFANKSYFSRIYPMDSKRKAGDSLRLFCQEFGVPEKLLFDGSK